MDKPDIEFWNGFLKGINAVIAEIEETKENINKAEVKGIEISLKIVYDLKEKVEKLHTKDILLFLEKYE